MFFLLGLLLDSLSRAETPKIQNSSPMSKNRSIELEMAQEYRPHEARSYNRTGRLEFQARVGRLESGFKRMDVRLARVRQVAERIARANAEGAAVLASFAARGVDFASLRDVVEELVGSESVTSQVRAPLAVTA